MGIAQLFFKKKNLLGKIELDVIITEGTSTSSVITKNPVQSGADFNDHIIVQPMTHRMSGAVSNASAGSIGQFLNLFSPRKDQATWEDLLELQVSGEPFELVQGLKTYPNVQITSLSEDQDKSTYSSLFFTATFQEIIVPVGVIVPNAQYVDQATFDKASPARAGGLKGPTLITF